MARKTRTETPRHMSLSALGGIVKRALEGIDRDLWVVAEIASLKVNRVSGHCYMDLVEKQGETVLAQMRANAWKGAWQKMAPEFRAATGSEPGDGMKVLLLVRVTYHEVYGLSLNVRGMDPSYTLGERERKRRETLERLKQEGLIGKNREREMPLVPQRIAVISSETAAGYGDFVNRMRGNPYGYWYSLHLYPAMMQGTQAEASIVKAIGAIARRAAEYDVAVIIRGGGSQVDLDCFDAYALARAVAECPLPVLTGIGHEQDEPVVDHVAWRRLITPSATAEFLVTLARKFEDRLEDQAGRLGRTAMNMVQAGRHDVLTLSRGLVASSRAMLGEQGHALGAHARGLHYGVMRMLAEGQGALGSMVRAAEAGVRHLVAGARRALVHRAEGIGLSVAHRMRAEDAAIENRKRAIRVAVPQNMRARARELAGLEQTVRLLDPGAVLRRGYSITSHEGRAVTDVSALRPGARVSTRLHRGEFTSTIERIKEDAQDGEEE
jgi:exodeoxyribonuclease VII large subunit